MQDLPLNKNGIIQKVDCEFKLRRRLYDLGFVPSEKIKVLSHRGKGMLIFIMGVVLCISTFEANLIEVGYE
ncbi:MAG: ferrous iron transport protein A [Clostridia bacterium]|nr:ferrous iron transport protein A [Clostridia bacterium]